MKQRTNLEEAPILAGSVEECRLLARVKQQPLVIDDGDLILAVAGDCIGCRLWPEIPWRHIGSTSGSHHRLHTRDGERFHLLALEMLTPLP